MKRFFLWIVSVIVALFALLPLIGSAVLFDSEGLQDSGGWLFLICGLTVLAFAVLVNPRAPRLIPRLVATRTRVWSCVLCVVIGLIALIPALNDMNTVGKVETDNDIANEIIEYGLSQGVPPEDFRKNPDVNAIKACLSTPQATGAFDKAAAADGVASPKDKTEILEYIADKDHYDKNISNSAQYKNRNSVVGQAVKECVNGRTPMLSRTAY